MIFSSVLTAYFKDTLSNPPYVLDACGDRCESSLHAIWDCTASNQACKKVWKLSRWKKSGKGHSSFANWFGALCLCNTNEKMELFAYICWLLWNERNNTWHGKATTQSPECVFSKALDLLFEFKKANYKINK